MIGTLRLTAIQIRLALMRFGWVNHGACLIGALAMLAWLWAVPHLHAQLAAQQQVLADAQQMLHAADTASAEPPRPAAQQHLSHFYATLGDSRYAEQQVKTLFAIARKTNLVLSQAEYKWASDKSGRYHTYQILLPVKGSYGALRQFCQQTLLAIPFAALDEVNFKREAIASSTLEARLRFTLYLRDERTPVPPTRAHDARNTKS